jgi:hypothetical protein
VSIVSNTLPHTEEIALSARDSAGIEVGKPKRSSGRPSIAVVLLASGERPALERALAAVGPACREFDARLVLVWPGSQAVSSVPADVDFVTVQVSQESSPAERRGVAARQCATDIMIFADEARACRLQWADVLSVRLGLERGTELDGSVPDWRAVLAGLGVDSSYRS